MVYSFDGRALRSGFNATERTCAWSKAESKFRINNCIQSTLWFACNCAVVDHFGGIDLVLIGHFSHKCLVHSVCSTKCFRAPNRQQWLLTFLSVRHFSNVHKADRPTAGGGGSSSSSQTRTHSHKHTHTRTWATDTLGHSPHTTSIALHARLYMDEL